MHIKLLQTWLAGKVLAACLMTLPCRTTARLPTNPNKAMKFNLRLKVMHDEESLKEAVNGFEV